MVECLECWQPCAVALLSASDYCPTCEPTASARDVAVRAWLDAIAVEVEEAARAAAAIVAEDGGVRLLRTRDGEWGVVDTSGQPAWTSDEVKARLIFASVPRLIVD